MQQRSSRSLSSNLPPPTGEEEKLLATPHNSDEDELKEKKDLQQKLTVKKVINFTFSNPKSIQKCIHIC